MKQPKKGPRLLQDEQIILHSPGGYKHISRSGWKLGHHYLTNKRLLFFQPGRVIFEIPLEDMTNVKVGKKFFVLKEKNVISLSYISGPLRETPLQNRGDTNTERILKAWIIMADLEAWKRKLWEMTAPPISEETVNEVAQELDPVSQEILWHLWQKGHATIDELTELVEAPTHMDVLLKIREDINPVAERIIGGPILVFERSKIDPLTGEKILFNWWLVGRKEKKGREILLDIFDERDYLDITMELLGLREEDIMLKVEKDKLRVTANASDKKYQEEIPLPAGVNPEKFTKKYHNNILAVKFEKVSDLPN